MSVSTVTSRRAYVSLGLSAIAVSALALGGVQSSAKPAQIVPPPPISNDLVSWQQFILAVTPSGVPGKVAYETFGYSEPGAGSDLASVKCKAERVGGPDGGKFIVNGQDRKSVV